MSQPKLKVGGKCRSGRHTLTRDALGRRPNGYRYCIPCARSRARDYLVSRFGACPVCDRSLKTYRASGLCYICEPQIRILTRLYAGLASGRGPKLKTACPYGHAYDVENTYYYIDFKRPEIRRQCRACMRTANLRDRRKHILKLLRVETGGVMAA